MKSKFETAFSFEGKCYGWKWDQETESWFCNLPQSPTLELLHKLGQYRPDYRPPENGGGNPYAYIDRDEFRDHLRELEAESRHGV